MIELWTRKIVRPKRESVLINHTNNAVFVSVNPFVRSWANRNAVRAPMMAMSGHIRDIGTGTWMRPSTSWTFGLSGFKFQHALLRSAQPKHWRVNRLSTVRYLSSKCQRGQHPEHWRSLVNLTAVLLCNSTLTYRCAFDSETEVRSNSEILNSGLLNSEISNSEILSYEIQLRLIVVAAPVVEMIRTWREARWWTKKNYSVNYIFIIMSFETSH